MFEYRKIITVIIIVIISVCSGCVKTSATDQAVIDEVQAYFDAPPDPSNPNALTAEERAMMQDFTITHNIVKVQLVEGTDSSNWETLGRKMVTAYAESARRHNILQSYYYGQLWIQTEVHGKIDNFNVGDFDFQNSNDRIQVELHNPSRDIM
ncbi:MAG: hypothetical protein NTY09_02655 [bacterium]|nr:hypothetical protein [bacterium]